jgi:hypothetical protein
MLPNNLVLSVLLLVIGTVATLSAFGGESWTKGKTPIWKRITNRGWISLACLAAALALGTAKEILSSRESAKSALELAQTRKDLSHEAEINLLTMLSVSPPVHEALFQLELPIGAGAASDEIQMLFPGIPPEYRDVIKVHFEFHPFIGINTVADLTYGDSGVSKEFAPSDPSKKPPDPIITLPPCLSHIYPTDPIKCAKADQSLMVSQETLDTADIANAAIAYHELSEKHSTAEWTLAFTKKFPTEAAMQEFVRTHAQIKPRALTQEFTKYFSTYAVEVEIPQTIRDRIYSYWKSATRPSHVYVYLRNSANLKISSEATIRIDDTENGHIIVSLFPNSVPEIGVGVAELGAEYLDK